MIDMKGKIKRLASEYNNEIIKIRRHIHAYPELSNKEYKTSDYIVSKLREYKIPFVQGIDRTGIVALIDGKAPLSKVIALRADMDALPINEENDVEYKSKNPGVMHACGHDVHIASLLGTAKILNELREDFEGSVKLIFQPSEEKFPGGALSMINEGILKNPVPQHIFAQHVMPELEVGKIGIRSGKYMASTDELYFTVKGKGGHAATPYLNIDPVLIAAHIIIALQQIISRNSNPVNPSVLSIGRVIADGSTNIIPNEVKMQGTFRTFDEKWRDDAHKKITKIAKLTAESMGGDCDVLIDSGYPNLINDEKTSTDVKKYAEDYLGKENVLDLEIQMTAEDFAYYSQIIPACFYRLGIGNKLKGIISNLHTPTFDVDEKCLEIGMGLMAWITINELKI